MIPFAHGRHLAAAIEGARFVEIPGADQPPFTEGADEIADAIVSFASGC